MTPVEYSIEGHHVVIKKCTAWCCPYHKNGQYRVYIDDALVDRFNGSLALGLQKVRRYLRQPSVRRFIGGSIDPSGKYGAERR